MGGEREGDRYLERGLLVSRNLGLRQSIESANDARLDAIMSPRIVIVVIAISGLCVATEDPSSFSKSAVSVDEFGDSDVRTADNEVSASEDVTFLGNFKSLHNSTDLQAVASDPQPVVSDSKQVSSDRADFNFRVLRGAEDELPGFEQPFFQAFKHNTIDNADFSDCALQGEWQPIGLPSNHYTHHHEDRQKEHFHAAAEGPDAFPTISVQSTKQPVDPEGVAFWNQFLSEGKGNPHLMGNTHHHKTQKPPHFDHSPHNKHHYQQKKRPQLRPPPPTFNDVDVFSNIRRPHPNEPNILKVQQKPQVGLHNTGPIAQALVSNKPAYNDIEFALAQKNQQHASDSNKAAHYKDVDYLSPPPAPVRFHPQKPTYYEKPKLPLSRPKYLNKPNIKIPHSHQYHGHPPMRPPAQVVEHQEEHIRGGSYQQPNPSESSTFTCGHQHSHGTNYHTASYQVEGEADPSLLEEAPLESNNFPQAQIILGQPHFDHGQHFHNDENDGLDRYPKSGTDLTEEGTEAGTNDHEEFVKEFEEANQFNDNFKEESNHPEPVTQDASSETTGPQTFHTETDSPVTIILRDSVPQADTLSPTYGSSFDHSASTKVHAHETSPGPTFTHSDESKFSYKLEESPTRVVVHQKHAVSHSEPNGFFGPSFGASFQHEKEIKPPLQHRQMKHHVHSHSPPTSFYDFSQNQFKNKPGGKFQKMPVTVFHHPPPPYNATKTYMPPKKMHPAKDYEVSEHSGEMIPVSAYFPPRKGPTQFDNRQPNFAGPKAKRPKSQSLPKYQSTIHYDGSGLEIYQTRPKNSFTRIKLKPNSPNGGPRFSEQDYRKSLTFRARL